MKQHTKNHLWYYLIFLTIQGAGIGLLLLTAGSKPLQLFTLFLMVVGYVMWPITHHHVHHTLTIKIVWEYVLIGLLGMILFYFLLP